MRAVVQLVSKAAVHVNGRLVSSINEGLAVLLGIHKADAEKDAVYLADKIVKLRVFPDERQLMNLSLLDVHGEMLVISQFTLFGDCRKGRRPSYSEAAPPAQARSLYEAFVAAVQSQNVRARTGEFQAMMEVSLINNGPVTLLLDTQTR